MIRITILSIALFFLFTSEKCNNKQAGDNRYDEDDVIEMSKTACFGTCPVYSITIKGNGEAVYEGTMNVEKKGGFKKKFSREETEQLFDTFAGADFWSFKDVYSDEVTDLPTTYLRLKLEDKDKKIKMYYGYPDELADLANEVAAMAETEGWLAE